MTGRIRRARRDTRANVDAATPSDGQVFGVTDKGESGIGDGATNGGLLFQRKNRREVLAPAQIAADQNNYAPAGIGHAGLLLLTSDQAGRTVTGINVVPASYGQERALGIRNTGSFPIVLAAQSASSTAANRFAFDGDVVLAPGYGVELVYDDTLDRWVLLYWHQPFAELTVAALVADANDFSPANLDIAGTLRLSASGAYAITGIAKGYKGREIVLLNIGSNTITLKDQNTGSAAANRFAFGIDVQLKPNEVVRVRYDFTQLRWVAVGRTFLALSDVPQDFALTGSLAPAQITGDQNNYAPAGHATIAELRLTADAARGVTGLAGGRDGRVVRVINTGTFAVTLTGSSTASIAANRFDFGGGDVTLATNQSATLKYDGAQSRWTLFASTSGGLVGAGAVGPMQLSSDAAGLRSKIGVREMLLAGKNLFVRTVPVAVALSIASPCAITLASHGLQANDPIVMACLPWRKAVTVTIASPGVFTLNAHGFAAGQPVRLETNGALPTGLSIGPTYFVIAAGLTTNTFQLSQFAGGSAIVTSGVQSGTHYLSQTGTMLANTATGRTVTMNIATPGVITDTAHGLVEGAPVQLYTTGTLPGLFIGTTYYVKSPTTDTYNLSAYPYGPAVATSGTQSGTHTLYNNIAFGQVYYVKTVVNANTFTFSDTLTLGVAGTAINSTLGQTGTIVLQTGNDANNGSAATRTGAFLTKQAAWDYALKNLDVFSGSIAINCADGHYRSGLEVSGEMVGLGSGQNILVTGNTTYCSNVLVQVTNNGACFTFGQSDATRGRAHVTGFRGIMDGADDTGNIIELHQTSLARVGEFDFGYSTGSHLWWHTGGYVGSDGGATTWWISGRPLRRHITGTENGVASIHFQTFNIVAPCVTTWAGLFSGFELIYDGNVFNGKDTNCVGGTTFEIDGGHLEAGSVDNDTYLPGTVAGIKKSRRLIRTLTYTASTTYLRTHPNVRCEVELHGGGGGGGGVGSAAGNIGAGGGGEGGYALKTNIKPGATETITIGAGGTAGANTGGTGGTGGTTSFGAWFFATGGMGGAGNTGAGFNQGGTGGNGSSGDINRTGAAGGWGYGASSGAFMCAGGIGAAGANAVVGTSYAGQNSGPGGGGSGAVSAGTTANAGGVGGGGWMIVREYE